MNVRALRARLTIRGRLTLTYGALLAGAAVTLIGLLYVVMMYGPSYSSELTDPSVSCSQTSGTALPSVTSAWPSSPARSTGAGLGGTATPGTDAAGSRDASGQDGTRTRAADQTCSTRPGLVSFDVSSKNDVLRALLLFGVMVGAVLLLISLVVGWFLAGRVLAPLQHITATARGIADSTLHERIDLDGPQDEIKELADTFDAMLTRLDQAFQAQRRFAANASHELRTPLASMRTILQVALSSTEPRDLREAAERLLVLNRRSTDITEALLTLARADHGAITPQPVDLVEITRELCAQAVPEAHANGVRITGPSGDAWAKGDRTLLRQMVANLIDNAVKHNHPGGTVTASLAHSDGSIRLTVRNSGTVLDEDAVGRAFEPFHRLAPRTQGSAHRPAGHGLGLAIVHAIVQAHDGTLTATPLNRGGLAVSVSLPEHEYAPAPPPGRSPVPRTAAPRRGDADRTD